MSRANIRREVMGPNGFHLGLKFTPVELGQVYSLIEAQWLARLESHAAEHAEKFRDRRIDRYHELAHLVDHVALWPKKVRVLSREAADQIVQMSPFRELKEEFGNFDLTDELKNGWGELCWRLVRPGQINDVGPLHADIWFHQIYGYRVPEGFETIKGWIAVCVETGVSGLAIVPGSHLSEWEFSSEERGGANKPRILVDESTLNMQIFNGRSGDVIMFHEKLLHRGVPHNGSRTRVSLEFTMMVKKI